MWVQVPQAYVIEFTHIHTSAKALPGTESRCELGPQRVIITVSINQLANSSKACFILIFPLSLPWQCKTVAGCMMTWFYLLCLSFLVSSLNAPQIMSRVVSSSSRQSSSVYLKLSLLTDSEAAVSRLNRLRQFQDNNRLSQLESSGGGGRLLFLCSETRRA